MQLFNGASVFLFLHAQKDTACPILKPCLADVGSYYWALPFEIVGGRHLVDDPDYNTFSKHAGRILNDINLRESMIRKGFEQVKRYSWTKSATTVLETYRKLLTQNP